MSRKPWRRKLRAAYSSVVSNARLGNADRSGEAHVPGGRLDAALGHVGDHRRDQDVAEALGDARGERLDADVVLAERHVRPALLGAADRNDHRRRAGADVVAQLGPGQILEEDRLRRRRAGRIGEGEAETGSDEPEA